MNSVNLLSTQVDLEWDEPYPSSHYRLASESFPYIWQVAVIYSLLGQTRDLSCVPFLIMSVDL